MAFSRGKKNNRRRNLANLTAAPLAHAFKASEESILLERLSDFGPTEPKELMAQYANRFYRPRCHFPARAREMPAGLTQREGTFGIMLDSPVDPTKGRGGKRPTTRCNHRKVESCVVEQFAGALYWSQLGHGRLSHV